LRTQTDIDSKFRFVILASKRAKQILKGSKPKIKTKSRNPISIAQEEIRRGLVDYEIIDSRKEEMKRSEEEFIREEVKEGEVDIDLEETGVEREKSKDELPEVTKKTSAKKRKKK